MEKEGSSSKNQFLKRQKARRQVVEGVVQVGALRGHEGTNGAR